MAKSNRDKIGISLDLLQQGLAPFVEREFQNIHGDKALNEARRYLGDDRLLSDKDITDWDASSLLRLMWQSWNEVFRNTLGHGERSIVSELREQRNKWAHQENFTGDDAYRALDSAHRLLLAVSAPQAEDIEKMKMELLRLRFDEQVRHEKRKTGGSLIEAAAAETLKPWREVVTPHRDVASGKYQQAEFAADLWQVHLGEGTPEYKDPAEFFRRTYITESLKHLLTGSVQRMSGQGGDPVIELHTNFGGGKTHTMLALYHLFSGVKLSELNGVDELLAEAGVNELKKVNRVVLVGNKISPAEPIKKADGTVVHTLWGELAYQLGGKKAYKKIAASDQKAANPGDALRELFNEYGPCLILIDEWVAYARQLHDDSDLPAGDFDTQFTFAQALTESAKLAKNCLLVISLPASDTSGSPHTQADDLEVGGMRGREALDRLRNVIGRTGSTWKPASAEESFEIVRRRLFEPMTETGQFKDRDVVARAFADLYLTQGQEFPPECRDGDYEKRIRSAYPIHPEIFDRLYTDWSTLVKFQRTRGVLRLMAGVIHSLWEKGDRNPLILPSMIPIDDPRVQFELTRYLTDNWTPVIEKDIDGPNSLPLQIDGEVPNLGKVHACRRVARTIYLGSAPITDAAHRGIEDRRVKLGCVMPGESPAVFGDAMRRLAGQATYLYQDGPRVWYSTQPTVTKLAEDRAEQLARDQDKVITELEKRIRRDVEKKGDFARVHPLPHTGTDVSDELTARLVVLRPEHPYSKKEDSLAETAAKAILESRGNTPRLYQNTLVFLAADKVRLQDLDEATRKYLAWQSILGEKEELNLDFHQIKQAETQLKAADSTVAARIPETYQWLLVPEQPDPQGKIEWEAIRVSGGDSLAARASKKLKNDELLVTSFAGTRLRMELDKIPLWRGDHVEVRQLVDDFARYLYLPRLAGPDVLVKAVAEGPGLLTWESDSFAFADSYDEIAKRYRGLRSCQNIELSDPDSPALAVKPDVARLQLDEEKAPEKKDDDGQGATDGEDTSEPGGGESGGGMGPDTTTAAPPKPTRFHGSVELDPTRVGRDAGRIAEEVISHLTGLVSSKVKITLDIEAEIPDGAPENVVRTVTENSRTLKFDTQGFEDE